MLLERQHNKSNHRTKGQLVVCNNLLAGVTAGLIDKSKSRVIGWSNAQWVRFARACKVLPETFTKKTSLIIPLTLRIAHYLNMKSI